MVFYPWFSQKHFNLILIRADLNAVQFAPYQAGVRILEHQMISSFGGNVRFGL